MPVTLPRIELSNGQLTFVSPKEEEGRKDDMVFEGKMVGKRLVGTATGPDNTPWFWIGEKAPYANAQQFLVRAQRRIQIDSQSAFTAIVESPYGQMWSRFLTRA